MTLHASERPAPSASRIHGPKKILGELVRLRGKIARCVLRDLTADETRWCGQLADVLDLQICAGTAIVSGGADPRTWRRVRKNRP
jgi:hypothetical protein